MCQALSVPSPRFNWFDGSFTHSVTWAVSAGRCGAEHMQAADKDDVNGTCERLEQLVGFVTLKLKNLL